MAVQAPHGDRSVPAGFGVGEGLVVGLVGVWCCAGVVFWLASFIASWFGGEGPFRAGITETVVAVVRLPGHLTDPAAAWEPPIAAALPGRPVLHVTLLVTVVAFAGVVGTAWRVWRRLAAERHALGVAPNAGLAAERDLTGLTVAEAESGRVVLGRLGQRLVAAEAQASVAVVGPTGSGKTAGFAIPALLEWEGPVVATSVKTDLIAATIERRRELGTVWIYDPAASTSIASSAWTPLAACGTWRDAQRMAAWMCEAAQPRLDTVSDGDYWYSQARKVLAPLLLAAATGHRDERDSELTPYTMTDLVRWVDEQVEGEVRDALSEYAGIPDAIDDLMAGSHYDADRERLEQAVRVESTEAFADALGFGGEGLRRMAERPSAEWPEWLQDELDEQIAKGVAKEIREMAQAEVLDEARATGVLAPLAAIESIWEQDPRLRGSVFATVQTVLLSYADPGVARLADECDIDADAWLSGSNTVFVVAPSHEQTRLRPVLVTLVQHLIQRAYEAANDNAGRLERPCLALLDEAGNIAPLRALPEYAATARSHGISVVSIWQDLAQIESIYGERARTVLNNHRAKVFGSGIADEQTLTYLSHLVGDFEFVERNHSLDIGRGVRQSVNERATYRAALPVDVLRRMRSDEALLIYGSLLPARLGLRPWFEDEGLRALADAQSQGGGPQARRRSTAAGRNWRFRKRHSLWRRGQA